MSDRLAELDGVVAPPLDDEEAVVARIPEILTDLVEPAKVTALEKLGEGEGAIRIASAWVRQRVHSRLDQMGKEWRKTTNRVLAVQRRIRARSAVRSPTVPGSGR
jgi:hypothetical protein